MPDLGGLAEAFAVLLVVAGVQKGRRPEATMSALRALRLPAGRGAARLLAFTELAIGAAAIADGSRFTWLLVGVCYLGFASFVVLALARRGAVSSCGCFGAPGLPPTVSHGLVTLAAAAVAFSVAVTGPVGPLLLALRGQPLRGVLFVVLSGCCAWFGYVAMAVLPKTAAFMTRPR